eukprot:NODE_1723_length_779_cov_241.795890_g1338_i0.p1 GENE.NODE_1723_length_779_cov_241.795890_g1338_i0~~NODE_1723_length_779_cov_241.795890_g1338_i0.p1  ORF type:complete len:158 (+),score=49.39 NODE_1723_length_779_cov_241.795890_g1338_i0:74-547(+)
MTMRSLTILPTTKRITRCAHPDICASFGSHCSGKCRVVDRWLDDQLSLLPMTTLQSITTEELAAIGPLIDFSPLPIVRKKQKPAAAAELFPLKESSSNRRLSGMVVDKKIKPTMSMGGGRVKPSISRVAEERVWEKAMREAEAVQRRYFDMVDDIVV